MKSALINHDPMQGSDSFSSEWEYAVECGYFSIEEVKELFSEGRINKQELDYALNYLESEV